MLLWLFAAPALAGPAERVDPELGAEAEVYSRKIGALVRGYAVRAAPGPADTPLPLDLANFLLDHTDLSASIAARHGLAPFRITMQGPRRSWADDGAGTSGWIAMTHRSETERVYYGEGAHKPRFLPAFHAASLILMDIQPEARGDCRPYVRTSFVVYVRLESLLLSDLAKVLEPFVRRAVARVFARAFLAADRVAELIARDPDAMSEEIRSFPALSPEDRAAASALLSRLKRARAGCR